MRVLFVTNVDVLRFGTAEVLHGLSSALLRVGIDVVCYGSDASAAHGRLHNGVPCYHGPLPRPRIFPRAHDAQPLIDVCRRHATDLVHCHNVYRPGWAAMLVQRATGRPFVATSQSDMNRDASARMHRLGVRWRCRQILQAAAALTHFNAFMLQHALAIAPIAHKSRIIPNGLDLAQWQRSVRPYPGNYVLALGRLVPAKGFDTLIAALERLAHQGQRLDLVIAGEGDCLEPLQQQARAASLQVCTRLDELSGSPGNRVCFPGAIAGEAKRSLFAGARLVAFPSHPASETFGLVVLEAMAAGKVVLASDIPSVREILAEPMGQRIAPRNSEAWAAGLHRFLSDPALCAQIGQHNRHRSEAFSWDTIAAQYCRVYHAAARRAGAA
jgi:glycosyltransferase involved in cell wall biosynthesis